MKKKKVYVLMVSKTFPAYHPRKGEQTYFMSKIMLNFDRVVVQEHGRQFASKPGHGSKYAAAFVREMGFEPKLHTIRENYPLWAKRAEKINKGEAILSLRQWTGSPYNYKRDGSKPVEFLRLEKISVQRVKIGIKKDTPDSFIKIQRPVLLRVSIDEAKRYGSVPLASGITVPSRDLEYLRQIAKNDGLNDYDFKWWFKKDMDGVIIHFCDFKY